MSLPALKSPPVPAAPSGFVPLPEAAKLIGCDPGHLRRACRDDLSHRGKAKQIEGAWVIASDTYPQLGGIETREQRDLRQLGELRAEESAKAIRRAEALRDYISGFNTFRNPNRPEAEEYSRYRNQCLSDGTIGPNAPIKKLKERQFRGLRAAYEAGGIAALVRKKADRQDATSVVPEWQEMALERLRSPNRPSLSLIYDEIRGFILQGGLADNPAWNLGSLRTFQLWVEREIPPAARVWMREGLHKFRAKCIPKITRDWSDVPAGTYLVGDERTFDFLTRVSGDRGPRLVRLKVTLWVCARSGKIIGWHIGILANTDTILASFKMACLGTGTLPDHVYMDNGPDYVAAGGRRNRFKKWDSLNREHVTGCFSRMFVEPHYARPRTPWAKCPESVFSRMTQRFDKLQPSYIGGSPEERPPDAHAWAKAHFSKCPSVDQVREQFQVFVDTYNDEPQRGERADGLSPNQSFAAYYTDRPRRVTKETLDLVCCRIIGPKTVSRDGVRHDRINYGTRDEAVFALQGRKVWLAVDPIERDQVTLCQEDGTPICVAVADHPIGLKSEEQRQANAFQDRCKRLLKEYAPSREVLLKTPVEVVLDRRRRAAKEKRIDDAQVPTPPTPISVRMALPHIEAAVAGMRKAVGAEALQRLGDAENSGQQGDEQGSRRRPLTIMDLPDVELPAQAPRHRVVDIFELDRLSQEARNGD